MKQLKAPGYVAFCKALVDNKGAPTTVEDLAAHAGLQPLTMGSYLSKAMRVSGNPVIREYIEGKVHYYLAEDFIGNEEAFYNLFKQTVDKLGAPYKRGGPKAKKSNGQPGLLIRLKTLRNELDSIIEQVESLLGGIK